MHRWLAAMLLLLVILLISIPLQRHAESRGEDGITPSQMPTTEAPTATQTLTAAPVPSATPTPIPSATPTATPEPVFPVGQGQNWALIFQDEFESPTLDRSRWTVCYWWDQQGCTNKGNHELEWYTPDNVLVQDGVLRLQAQAQPIQASDGVTYPYTSGMVTTGPASMDDAPRFAFQTGYAEIRAHTPSGKGLWPAFWLLPSSYESIPEIDVLEILGDTPSTVRMHFHYHDEFGWQHDPGQNWDGPDFSADWHTYAVDWRTDQIIWYVDGVERWRFAEARYVPATEMYLLINLAVGGQWPGAPDAQTVFPSSFEIDYVRVWRTTD